MQEIQLRSAIAVAAGLAACAAKPAPTRSPERAPPVMYIDERSERSAPIDAGAPIDADAGAPLQPAHSEPQIAIDEPAPSDAIEGVVIGADGKPVAGAYVDLAGDRPGHTCCVQHHVAADANGRVRFEQEPAGARLSLWARSKDHAYAAVAGVVGRGVYKLVLEPATTLDVKVARVPGVGGPPDQRIADVFEVRIKGRTGMLRQRIAASGGAGLHLAAALPGEFVVEVETWCGIGAPPCAGAIARGRIEPGRSATVALRVERYGVAEGIAIDPATKQPIADAPIACDDGPCVWDVNGAWRDVRTGPDGRYRITGLAHGMHELRFGDRVVVAVVVKPG